jgi:hypothetical protein
MCDQQNCEADAKLTQNDYTRFLNKDPTLLNDPRYAPVIMEVSETCINPIFQKDPSVFLDIGDPMAACQRVKPIILAALRRRVRLMAQYRPPCWGLCLVPIQVCSRNLRPDHRPRQQQPPPLCGTLVLGRLCVRSPHFLCKKEVVMVTIEIGWLPAITMSSYPLWVGKSQPLTDGSIASILPTEGRMTPEKRQRSGGEVTAELW